MSTSEFTKLMIAQATRRLLEEQSFEALSVADIAKACNVSRNTIYYHFRDKYDIVNWIFYSEIMPIVDRYKNLDNWDEGLLELCRYLQAHKKFYLKVLHVQGQNSFSECLMEFGIALVKNLLMSANADVLLSENQLEVIANFYAHGLIGVLENWANSGMESDPKPVVTMLKDLFSGEIFDKLLSLQERAL